MRCAGADAAPALLSALLFHKVHFHIDIKESFLGAPRSYVIARLVEQGEHRETFQTDLKAAELEARTARAAQRVYDKLAQCESISKRLAEKLQDGYDSLVQGESAGKRAAAELQASLRSAAAQKAEIDADLTVEKTEGIIRLRPLYTAVQRAAETGGKAAFEDAKERYAYAYALEQAKHQAAKAKVQSSFNAVDDGVKKALAGVQGQFAASAGGVNSGILDHTSDASPYGKIDRPVDATWDDSRLNKLQAFLDAVGMIPGFGEAVDGLNALISLIRGD